VTGVFIVPAADPTARENLARTVRKRVAVGDLSGLSPAARKGARAAADGVWAWGTQPGPSGVNVTTWEALAPGDWVLFYSEHRFPVAGRILTRERSRDVADRLWGTDEDGATWEYLYLIDLLRWIDAPLPAVRTALSYRSRFYPRRFSRVDRTLEPRYDGVGEMLDDLEATGVALRQAVKAASSGDRLAASTALDPLIDRMSKADLERSIATYTSSAPPRTRKRVVKELERDRSIVVKLKRLYEDRCQCCGFTFAKASGKSYSEVAHLRPIALREANLDTKDNLFVLCPNHHKMLDFGRLEIEYDRAADRLLFRENGRAGKMTNKHVGPGRPKKKK